MLRVLLMVGLAVSALSGQVKVWQASIQLPTYAEGDPDPIPQFAAFNPEYPVNYPYPIRSQISANPRDRSMVEWRTLNLENEFLSCRILPDLGGHIYNCRDKLADREMFHVASVIKKAIIGQRGAWISTGVEPNFPVTHSRVSASPVNFKMQTEADGAASVIVSDTDRVTGMQWRVEYRLQPGSAMLEQRVRLYNPSAVRKPFLWWNNAAIEWDDPQIRYIFPTKLVVTHDGTSIETWPISSKGVDISAVDNNRAGAAWFAYRCREPFMAIYKPKFHGGLAHYADAAAVSGKKLWIMGLNEVDSYRERLTDGGNMYVEMQAGSFTDQETYEFLEPEQSRVFSEFWIPFRNMSGLTRSTRDLVLFAARAGASLSLEVSAVHAMGGARIRVLKGDTSLLDTKVDLDPTKVWKGSVVAGSAEPLTIQVQDAEGRTLLTHREGAYDASPPAGIKLGDQKPTDWNGAVTQGFLLKRGDHNEKQNVNALAQSDYAAGLKRFSRNLEFDKAAGRLALSLGRFEEAAVHLQRATGSVIRDDETLYYAGLAESENGRNPQASTLLSQVEKDSEFGPAAARELSFLAARGGDYKRALAWIEPLQADAGRYARIAAIRCALLRRMGDKEAARAVLTKAIKVAPEDSALRYQGTLLGIEDADLWSYLAGDAERVLDIADGLMHMGLWAEALACLAHDFTKDNPHFYEPGAVAPDNSAVLAYYRAFCKTKLNQDPAADVAKAANVGSRYQFPSRFGSYAVLREAVSRNPSDATAHVLLGNLDMYSLRLEDAAAEWEKAVALDPKLEIERKNLTAVIALLRKKGGPFVIPEVEAPPPTVSARSNASARAPAAEAAPPLPPKANPESLSKASDLAADAMIKAATGQLQRAADIFRQPAFASDQQLPIVRQAYIEVQLQLLLAISGAKQCSEIQDRVETLGLLDQDIPFTLYGFGQFIKLPHFQYYLGVVEANCGLPKQAQKYWAKVAKMKTPATSPEFAYSLLAAARVDPAATKGPAIQAANETPPDAADFVRSLNHALALRAAGDEATALPQLGKIARESTDPVVRYLATVELGLRVH